MPHRLDQDPFYQALLADLADTRWQIREAEFLEAWSRSMRLAARKPVANPTPEDDGESEGRLRPLS